MPVAIVGVAEPPGLADSVAAILRVEVERGTPVALTRFLVPSRDKPGDADVLYLTLDDAARTPIATLQLRPEGVAGPAAYVFEGAPIALPPQPLLVVAPVDSAWVRLASDRKLSREVQLSLVAPGSGAPLTVKLEAGKRPRGDDPDRHADDPPESLGVRAPLLTVGEKSGEYRLRAGAWSLTRDLVVPRGASLVVEPGTTLLLAPGRGIFAYGRLELQGTAASPITVAALGRGPWATVAVLGAAASGSRFTHVHFLRGSGGYAGTQDLNGVVSVVDSRAEFAHCRFEDARGEDAVHAERAELDMVGSEFLNLASDGLDLVASRATVASSIFETLGDDGIDAGHDSTLTVTGSLFRGAMGKAISVGQRSTAVVRDTFLLESGRGLSAFDSGTVTATNCVIARSRRAAAQATVKVDLPGKIALSKSFLWQNASEGSRLFVDIRDCRDDLPFELATWSPIEGGVGPSIKAPISQARAPWVPPASLQPLFHEEAVEAAPLVPVRSGATWIVAIAGLLLTLFLLLTLERRLRSPY
ncbi:MAG: right-handed parallel beta-helix repeat-containing protein [Myxococcales bacterium]|nr:right-handed parallel beta-helix repeat-containing protein [Myxococcales bacterium]